MPPKREVYGGPEKGAGYRGPYHQGHPLHQQARDDSPATGYPASAYWRPDDQRPGADLGGPTTHVREQNCYPASDHSDGKPACDWSGGKPLHDLGK
jgi:hypothetical protein